MHFPTLFAASVPLNASAHAKFSGYYNISTAMHLDTPVYLHFENQSLNIIGYTRYESLQQWYFTGSPTGYYFIANRQGGVLTAIGTGRQARGNAFDPDAICRQAWKINNVDDWLYEFESKQYPGHVLDLSSASGANYTPIVVAHRNHTRCRSQLWWIGKPTIDSLQYGW